MRPGRVRDPVVVLILSLITCGIYSIFFYYSTFEELSRWRGAGWTGGLFLLFYFVTCGIPLIALPWLMPHYVSLLYEEDGQAPPITWLSGFWVLLPLLGGIIWLFVWQTKLNEFWRMKGARG